jgi:hypothetical protein
MKSTVTFKIAFGNEPVINKFVTECLTGNSQFSLSVTSGKVFVLLIREVFFKFKFKSLCI